MRCTTARAWRTLQSHIKAKTILSSSRKLSNFGSIFFGCWISLLGNREFSDRICCIQPIFTGFDEDGDNVGYDESDQLHSCEADS
ncbi:hypothetical protein OIU85_009340 [Salix viminalis]|uniref:Uncharacterized protein n=1 Tax=Salix viminalis TaxID=40686 RepID=A0A9Q0NZP6_SALVM|nr:hypothetical protein OIU85_009340 [Salix viminalis]